MWVKYGCMTQVNIHRSILLPYTKGKYLKTESLKYYLHTHIKYWKIKVILKTRHIWPKIENHKILLRKNKDDLNKRELYHASKYEDSTLLTCQYSSKGSIYSKQL